MRAKYKLSSELLPKHDSDVKSVLAVDDQCIASASRDGSVGIWKRASDQEIFKLTYLLGGHKSYVNSLCYIPKSEHWPDTIASGGNSSLILLHRLDQENPDPYQALLGHFLNVCTLQYSVKQQKLISGSWDHTARIWEWVDGDWKSTIVLDGHTEAVWGAFILEGGPKSGCYLTGSADKLIKLWSETGEQLATFKGSPEPVRGLTQLADQEHFASVCNDGLLRIWDLSGSILTSFTGHTDYVYQIASRNDLIVTCGEDHTARVWDVEGEGEIATLVHPCQTVWSESILPNGDVVTAGSDGFIRVWSQSPVRQAGTAVLQDYEARTRDVQIQKSASVGEIIPVSATSQRQEPVTIDIDLSDDNDPLKLVVPPDCDLRTIAEEFGREHNLSDNYVNRIEEFLRANVPP